MSGGKIAVLGLAALLGVGTTMAVLELTSDESDAQVIQLDEGKLPREEDTAVVSVEEDDGDRTRGDDGTNGGNNTDRTAGSDGTNGGNNTGDQDGTPGDDGTRGGNNTGGGGGGSYSADGGGGGGSFSGGGGGSFSGGGSGSGG